MGNERLEAALSYARRGWPVLPCRPRGKAPLTARGVLDATRDQERIKHWWRAAPRANVGIRTGVESGLIVVDVDPRGGGDEGLWELEQRYTRLPPTAEALTGGGGRHLYFEHPGGRVRCATALGGYSGVDLKADGGYVVAPPSLHASGRRYTWEVNSAVGDVPLAPAPAWLVNLANGGPGGRGGAGTLPAGIKEGERNTLLASLAGSLRRRGASEEAILAALRVENEMRCRPPLGAREVAAIARSICRYPAGHYQVVTGSRRCRRRKEVIIRRAEL